MDRVRDRSPKSIGTLRVLDDVRVLTLLIINTKSMTKASGLILKSIKIQERKYIGFKPKNREPE